jgi:hypothetical protein
MIIKYFIQITFKFMSIFKNINHFIFKRKNKLAGTYSFMNIYAKTMYI